MVLATDIAETSLTVDGVRFSTGTGWGLVRVSNTEPALTIRAEAHTTEELKGLVSMMRDKLAAMPVDIALDKLEAAPAALG